VLLKLLLSLISYFLILGVAQNPGGYYVTGWLAGLLWDVVYLVTAAGAAYARLRPGRRM
jgi:hypothetical protein